MAKQKILRKTYHAVETKAASEGRRLIVTISTVNPDRSRDVVQPGGVILDAYNGNPVVAAFHNYYEPAIARTVGIEVMDDRIVAELEFPPEGIYKKADELYGLYKNGFMNAWSIGFIPKEWTDRSDGGREFTKWELLEYSAVLVPDNPQALTMLRSKGIEAEESKEDSEEVTIDTKQLAKLQVPDTQKEPPVEVAPNDRFKDVTVTDDPLQVIFHLTNGRSVAYPATKELADEMAELKEGRVISGANRKKIESAAEALKNASTALDDLLKLSDKEADEEKSHIDTTNGIALQDALRVIDKVAGKALRDAKADKAN